MNKTFIAISFLIQNNKLVYIITSSGEFLSDDNGITAFDALTFLHSLVYKRKKQKGLVFVTYSSARDYEFLFSDLSSELKDKIFESHKFRNEVDKKEYELELLENDLYKMNPCTNEYQLADFEKHIEKLSLKEFCEIEYKGFYITLRQGKFLIIRAKGKSIQIDDVYGFFKKPLYESVKIWLSKDIYFLDTKYVLNAIDILRLSTSLDIMKNSITLKCHYIALLAQNLNERLQEYGINLRHFYGTSGIASHVLGQWKAKDYYFSYPNKRQYSPELYKGCFQGYYGGRSEQHKIGTIKNVNIYDINSAYAYAACFLPVMLSKPYFVNEWKAEPFSLWYAEYDFSKLNLYFGLLPNRDSNSIIRYKTRGKGYFYQPEIQYIINNYPECIDVKHGFVLDYKPIPFAKDIEDLYNLRVKLQKENNPLEKIIKGALHSIYGKFFQSKGKGRFYNAFYAGFICSFLRMMLLEATKGREQETICFQTDAIHTTANLDVEISDKLGAYKKETYDKIQYLDIGLNRRYKNGKIIKEKTQGFKTFNFDNALQELNNKYTFSGSMEYFNGHNLYELEIFKDYEYLSEFETKANVNPFESAMRIYDKRFDDENICMLEKLGLSKHFLDSRIIPFYNGQESLLYNQSSFVETDIFDKIEAMKI